jgi:hypothetical protein
MFYQQYGLSKIAASNAWQVSTGSSNVVVAILDSGINYHHEDLAPNMWRNPGEIPGNGMDDDGNGYIDDVHGIDTAYDPFGRDTNPLDQGIPVYHGTALAGIIGAASNNGKGVAGLNWNVQLMALRFLRTTNYAEVAEELEALEYVVAMKQRGINIRVLSMSYGGTEFSMASKEAHEAVSAAGVLQVASAGNFSANIDSAPTFPATLPIADLISVAASDSADLLAPFSSYGRTNCDLAAPGVGIVSTGGSSGNDYYGQPGRDGTSYSAPYVAGAAALLFAAYPSATALEVKAALLDSADVLPAFTNKMVSNGRLNVARAMQSLGGRLTKAPPNITFQPPERTTIVLSNAYSLNAVFTGTPPFSFQWLHNGMELVDGTNATYGDASAPASDAGDYRLVVSNGFGVVTSAVARLEVLTTPVFVRHPQPGNATETSNITFAALATGYAPQYQWLSNGVPMLGATTTNLTLTNVNPGFAAAYSVRASNSYGVSTSDVAPLTVFTFPRMVEPGVPLRIAVVRGETVTLGVRTTGTLPIGYRWRRASQGITLTNISLNANECFFTFVATNEGTYTLILTNAALPLSSVQRTNAIITVLADSDGDGLPDEWENNYASAGQPDEDTDGDGVSNADEYRAGTNPLDGNSRLRIERLVMSNNIARLDFLAVSNKTYAIEQRQLVHTGAWTPMANVVSGSTDRRLEVTDTNNGVGSVTQKYYRVVTPKP